jgi:hypothetical protein
VKGKHVGDFRYLEEIAQAWSEGWRVGRTQQVEEVKINLRDPSSNADMVLEFADLSGETYERAFATRLCTPAFIELVKDAAGVLLFVSADRVLDDVTILDAFGDLSEENHVKAVSREDDGGEEVPWNPEKTPLQVQIVDLLQTLQLAPFIKRPFKIAVIVSAWDLSAETSAETWLEKKMPLLDQYLRNGEGATDMRVYGVSAQGGKLTKKGEPPSVDRERLLSIVPASKRILIVGNDVSEHDLTAPIKWLTGAGNRV